MTAEQLFPTRWILNTPTRKQLADHLRGLRRIDRAIAKQARRQALWIGSYPSRIRFGEIHQ